MNAHVPVKRPLTVRLATPRGFCAGVDRAIQIVERAIEKFGAPVYVRHEIVHNRHVVDRLKGLGAVFVKELDECPDDRPVVFSAHGVPKSVPTEARQREMIYLDATCPLVSKVHVEAQRHYDAGKEIVLIGTIFGFRIWERRIWEHIFQQSESALLEDPSLFRGIDLPEDR